MIEKETLCKKCNHDIHIKVSQEDLAKIKSHADQLEMSISGYVKFLVLKVKPKVDWKEV